MLPYHGQMKTPTLKHKNLLKELVTTIPHTGGCIIGIDGRNGSGKTSMARWLAWQTGWDLFSLDNYMVPYRGDRIRWASETLRERIAIQASLGRNVIVESVCLLDAFEDMGLEVDRYVYVLRVASSEFSSLACLSSYFARRRSDIRARARRNVIVGRPMPEEIDHSSS